MMRFFYPEPVKLVDPQRNGEPLMQEQRVVLSNGSMQRVPTDKEREPLTLLALFVDIVLSDPRAGAPTQEVNAYRMGQALANVHRALVEADIKQKAGEHEILVTLDTEDWKLFKKWLEQPSGGYDPRVLLQISDNLLRAVMTALDETEWKKREPVLQSV